MVVDQLLKIITRYEILLAVKKHGQLKERIGAGILIFFHLLIARNCMRALLPEAESV
jgi:hypothetical protein